MVIERRWNKWLYFYIPLAVFILFTLFPFYWMAVTAFRPDGELYRTWRQANATPFWTLAPTLEHFQGLLASTEFLRWLANTMFIALASKTREPVVLREFFPFERDMFKTMVSQCALDLLRRRLRGLA